MSDQGGGHDLSHIKYEGGNDHDVDRIAIVVSKWNDKVTNTLYEGARETLIKAGVLARNIHHYQVPGSYELPQGAQFVLDNAPSTDAVICLGVVIQGETRHFDFICDSVAHGLRDVGLKYNRPVIFGVLTLNTQQQADDRAGGKYGNKGEEAAVAALEMIDLYRQLNH